MTTNPRTALYERYVFIGESADMDTAPMRLLLELDPSYATEEEVDVLLDNLALKLSKYIARTLNDKTNKGTVN